MHANLVGVHPVDGGVEDVRHGCEVAAAASMLLGEKGQGGEIDNKTGKTIVPKWRGLGARVDRNLLAKVANQRWSS